MPPAPVVFTHPSSLAPLNPPGHPEQAARMTAILSELDARDWLGYERRESRPAEPAELERVHLPAHVETIAAMAAAGGRRVDADTVVSPDAWTAARHAAGGALELVERLLDGSARTGASLHRPPGHHAEPDRAMGFCLFDSVAVAAAHALAVGGLRRVMIVDYDVHHGNGTNAAFHDDPRVLFVSVHQSPLYPGTGPLHDVGSGAGAGFSVNLPVPPGAGDRLFRGMVDGLAVPLARAFAPELLLLSAGFDAAAADPLADGEVTDAGFSGMTASLRDVAAELGIPAGLVLEGGYSLEAMPRGLAAAMEALAAPAAAVGPGPGSRGADPWPDEVAAARAFLARWWPVLG